MGVLGTLVWKNLLYKRRTWKNTLLEVAVPALMFLLIVLASLAFVREDLEPVRAREIYRGMDMATSVEINWHDTDEMRKVRFAFHGSLDTFDNLRQVIGNMGEISYLSAFASEEDLRYAVYNHGGTFWLGIVEHNSGPQAHYSIITSTMTDFGDITRSPSSINHRAGTASLLFYASSPFMIIQGLCALSLHNSGAVRFNPEGRLPTMQEVSDAMKVTVGIIPLNSLVFSKTLQSSSTFICCALFLGFAFVYLQSLASLVGEKESRITELMRTMGASRFEIVAAWWVVQMGVAVASAGLVSIVALATVLNHFSPVVIFSLYIVTACFFVTTAIALSPLFASTRAAQLIGSVFFLIMFLAAYSSDLGAAPFFVKSLCLVPGVGFFLGVRIALNFAVINEYFSLAQMSDPVLSVSLTTVLTFTVFGFLVAAIVGLYVNLVAPSGFDTPLPWHFPITTPLRLVSAPSSDAPGSEALHGKRGEIDALFAAGPRTRPGARISHRTSPATAENAPIVQLRSLRRVFSPSNPPAVRCLDLDIHRGEIVALLGRSGSGKSTVLAMITGALAPTGGYVRVCGQDVTTGGGASAGLVGVCPQDNALFDDLTVADHLDLFARLKGIGSSNARSLAVQKWADRTGLGPDGDNKLGSVVKDLSGGQKRKLCLAMAFIGDPQLVILDEPTAGLDFSAQRSVRELLHAERRSRAILLSTHSMEEAEVCDRVVILAEGSLQCDGPPAFLKHEFGAGYTLTVTKVVDKTPVSKASDNGFDDQDDDEDDGETMNDNKEGSNSFISEDDEAVFTTESGRAIFRFLCSFIPDLHPVRDVVGDISLTLPVSSSTSLPTALFALDDASASLCVGSYTISVASLDDVFARVSEAGLIVDDDDDDDDDVDEQASPSTTAVLRGGVTVGSGGARSTTSRAANEEDPLLIPHQELRRDASEGADEYHAFASVNEDATPNKMFPQDVSSSQWGSGYEFRRLYPGVPFYKMLRALYMKHARASTREALSMRWQVLVPVLIIYASSFLTWAVQLTATKVVPLSMELFNGPVFNGPRAIDMPILASEPPEVAAYRSTLADSFAAAEFRTYVNIEHASATYEEVCNDYSPKIKDYFLDGQIGQHRNHFRPFAFVPCKVRQFPPSLDSNETTELQGIIYVNSTANHPWPVAHVSTANAWMHAAHVAQGKQGPPPTLRIDHYEESHFMWSTPLRISSIMIMVYGVIIAGLVFLSGVAVVRERALGSMHLQFISGAPRGAYWLSHALWELTLALTHLAAIYACLAVFNTWGTLSWRAWLLAPGYLAFILASIPISHFASVVSAKPELAQTVVMLANALVILAMSLLVVLPNNAFIIGIVKWLSVPIPSLAFLLFLSWAYFAEFDIPMCVYSKNDFRPFYTLFAGVALTWTLLILLEADSLRNVRARLASAFSCSCSPASAKQPSDTELSATVDPDVAREEELVASGGCDNAFSFPVVIKGLRKVFPAKKQPFVAVSNLSFAVSRGQCFGFLGANGAGKSTTMRMLTGDVRPTAGVARINGFGTEQDRAVASMLTGYCPQSDAFFMCLTPRENLRFFAVLRGISDCNITRHVDELLTRTGLAGSDSDVAAELLSVGNKRKLSVAIALIGNPPVVILDEPTAGIDPHARHEIWSLVSSTMENRSVILTTHSMEECEALCDRIGIMAGGVLRCIGVPSYVKSMHGSGYTCSITLANDADTVEVETFLSSTLPGSRCVSRNGAALSVHVPLASEKRLADVFLALEAGRAHGIEAYSACSADLGDVFENVVHKQ